MFNKEITGITNKREAARAILDIAITLASAGVVFGTLLIIAGMLVMQILTLAIYHGLI